MNLKWKFHPKLQNKTGCSKGRYSATLPLPSEREKKHSILFYPSLFFLAHCSLWFSSSLPCRPSLSPHSPYHSLFLSGLHQIVPPFSSIYLYIYIYTLSTLALATIVGSLNIQDYPCMFSFFHSGLQSKHHKENFGSRHAFCTYCHVLLIPIFSFLTLQLLLTLHLFFYIRYSICVFFFIFWSCSTIYTSEKMYVCTYCLIWAS